MRFHTITLKSFGPFDEQTVSFDRGLSLLFGNNEAGKSTLLRAVRAAFFGTKSTKLGDKTVRTLDGWEGARSSTAVSVQAITDDGSELAFERTNSRKQPVDGRFGDAAIDVDSLAAILNIDDVQYQNVFAFTLDELRAGEQSLLDASVIEVLFGGGLGRLAEFRALQKQIEKLAGEQFKARGRNQPVNAGLLAVHDREKQLRERLFTPTAYREKEASIAALRRRITELQVNLEDRRCELQHMQRLSKAQSIVARIDEVRAKQDSLALTKPVREADVSVANNALAQHDRLESELIRLRQQIATRESTKSALAVNPLFDAAPPRIKRVYAEASRVQAVLRELPTLKIRLAAIEQKLSKDSQATELPSDAAERLSQWSERADEVKGRILRTTAELESVEARLAETNHALSATCDPKYESTVLAAARKWQEIGNRKEQVSRLQEEINSKAGRVERSRQRLLKQLDIPEWPSLLVESLSVDEARAGVRDESRLSSEVDVAREAFARLEAQQQSVADELELLSSDPTVVSIDALRSVRDKRDGQLDELKRLVESSERERSLRKLDEATATVRDADDLSDRMTANAQAAAREASLKLRLTHIARDVAAATEALRQAESDLRSWTDQWQRRWANAGVSKSIRPEAAENWLREAAECEQDSQDLQPLFAELDLYKQIHDEAVEELKAISAKSLADAQLDVRLAWLETEAASIRERQTARRMAEQQLPGLKQARDAAQASLAKLTSEKEEIEAEFNDWKQAHKQEPNATLVQLTRLIERDDHLRNLREQADEATRAIAESETEIAAFSKEVEAIREILEVEDSGTAVDQIEAIHAAYEVDQEARSERAAVEREIAHLQAELAPKNAEFAQLELQLDEIRANYSHGEESEADFRLAVQKSVDFWTLDADSRLLMGQLEILAGDDSRDRFLAESREKDSAAFAASISACQAAIESTVNELETENGNLAVELNELAQISQSDRLADLQSSLESDRAELREAVERYAPLVVLQSMLDRAIARFGANVRPELLSSVAELFGRLTDRAYIEVDRSLEADTLRVQEAAGNWKTPAELSTGTRELLYLAIRLAFVQQHARNHESLPILMDDVLVNIDAPRTRVILQTLRELSEEMQIVLMTCRPELAAIFEQLGLEDSILEIQPGQLTGSRNLIAFNGSESSAVAKVTGSQKPRTKAKSASGESIGGDDAASASEEKLLFDS